MDSFEASIRKIVAQVVDERLQSQPKFKSITETCEALGVSRTSLWRGIKTGKIKVTEVGNRKVIDLNQFSK